jgi:predicted murein hydrolase (TIGR00659 family)
LNLVITVYSIVLTIVSYLFAREMANKYPTPFTTPVFLSTVIVIMILSVSSISYEKYQLAKEIMTFLLGPATVALALPLYKHRKILFQNLFPALVGLVTGIFSTIISAVLLAKLFHLGKVITTSLSIKSITIPVASEVAKIIGGDAILVAAIVMITGMIGAMFGPWLLNKFHILHPFARGISMGTIAHGIGTAEAIREGELQGAVAGVAMGLAAIITSMLIPLLLPALL